MSASTKELLNVKNLSVVNSKGNEDIAYYTCACMYHTQSTETNGTVRAVNVVDLESPGKITVYKKGVDTPATVDLNDFNTARDLYRKIKDNADATFTEKEHREMKKNLTMFIYAAYSIPPEGGYYDEWGDGSSGWNSAEAICKYYWWSKDVQKYIMSTGLLDSSFCHSQSAGLYAPSTHAEYEKIVDKILESPSLEKQETTLEPTVDYKNGKAYIGPFKIKYTGGTPSIKIAGNEVKWVEKVNDEYNQEQEASAYVSQKEFYVVLDEETAKNLPEIKVDFELSYSSYKVKLFLVKNGTEDGQCLMYHAGKEDTGSIPESWIVNQEEPKYGDLTIIKKDESGNVLQGVEFAIWKKDKGYMKLSKDSKFISEIDEEIDINDYDVEYVQVADTNQVTKFITNSAGKIVIKNLEYSDGRIDYNYWACEEANNRYGYKGMKLGTVTITQGCKVEQVQGDAEIEFSIGEEITEVELTVENKPELSNLEIIKVSSDEQTVLSEVKFKIEIGTGKYLQLQDVNGIVTSSTGEITINKDNVAQGSQYAVKYVDKIEEATIFITDSNGKIIIKNLEVNEGLESKYTYTVRELENTNYGYGSSNNSSLTEKILELKLNENNTITLKNTQDLGDLQLEKIDKSNQNIKLSNVGFVIEAIPSLEKEYAYITLYNTKGDLVSSVGKEVTINAKNKAQDASNGREYELRYYYSDKQYKEMTDEEKLKITKFITGEDGILKVNNLEVYSPKTGEKYTYKLIEVSNENYGYDVDSVELGDIVLETNETTVKQLENEPIYVKISGYVWIENSEGKSNKYDGVYTTDGEDQKLTDLYIIENGKLVKNPKATTPVEIKLRDKDGNIIKEMPDEFDENGKYTFVDIEIQKMSEYEVVFVYDGFYYTTIVEQLDKDNGSKVKEVASERKNLSNKFATVKNNNEVVSKDGTVNTVEYYKDGHTSTVSRLNFDTTVSANTGETNYNLKAKYDEIKANTTEPVEGIDNINMGIVLREQPKISINSDIYSALIEFEGYKYNYKYNGRQNYYENKNGDDIGVKFEQENTEERYTLTVYSSDVQAAKDYNKELKLDITYKIQIANESKTLVVMPKQIINYFDARYDIKAVGLGLDESTHTVTDLLTCSTPQNVEGHPEYKSTIIDFSQLIQAQHGNVKNLYITFSVQRDAILDLLNNKSTYHNATEILSYTSYYGEETSKVDGMQYITDQTKAGEVYAGIDKMSAPGNMEIVLKEHPNGEGTKILDTTNYEDDTTSAPSLLLKAEDARKVSGHIWEDGISNTSDNQKLGDGIYRENEKPIQGVKVTLHHVNNDGTVGDIAIYSNGAQVTTTTNESGNYTFGYYDEQNKKHVGILPGRYVIKYTYNNSSYIVGHRNINVNDYKSTIIKSEAVKKAFDRNDNERWYLAEEANRYSDARDNINLRPEYNPNIDPNLTVTNSTYNELIKVDTMDAYTPIMNIGIEFTNLDEADALTLEIVKELKNVDFGIVERPDIDITIKKEITGLEIVAQNGTNIIPYGDPSDVNTKMQYVRKLPGLITAELETKLLQGAKLNLEYTISIVNNSDRDYMESEYYYYGTGGRTESTTRAKQVVDYLDSTMTLSSEQNEGIWEVKTIDNLYAEGNELIHEDVYNALRTSKYNIATTSAFEEVTSGNEKSVKLYATKYLAVDDKISEQNHVEIIELTGKRAIKESIPGNYNPVTSEPNEQDDDKVQFVLTPPTGTKVQYGVYIIAIFATLSILVLGIAVIKKKIIK